MKSLNDSKIKKGILIDHLKSYLSYSIELQSQTSYSVQWNQWNINETYPNLTNQSNCNYSTPTKFSAISHSKKKHVGKHKESDSQDLCTKPNRL